MKPISGIILLLSILWLQSCAPSMNADWQRSDYQKTPTKKVLVIAMMKNLEARQSLENSIVQELRENHPQYQFTTGLDLFPPNMNANISEEQIDGILAKADPELVIATSFDNKYTQQNYVPGSSNYAPVYYRVGRYIYSTWDYMYTDPGYVETYENYVLNTNVYDTRIGESPEQTMIWTGQSEVSDPGSIRGGAADYAHNLVRYLDKNDILP